MSDLWSPVGRLLGGLGLLAGAIVAFVVVVVADENVDDLRGRQCDAPPHLITARVPGHVLPLAITAVVLAVLAVVVFWTATTALRRAKRTRLRILAAGLIRVAVIATIVVYWFGVNLTLNAIPLPTDTCT